MIESKADDPIADKSMSLILLISSLVLLLTLVWALYDEVFGLRPWKAYQDKFVKVYTSHLRSLKPTQKKSEEEVKQSAEYQKIEADIKEEEARTEPRRKEINAKVDGINKQLFVLTLAMQETRSKLAALTYQTEEAGSENSKQSYRKEIEDVKKGPYTLELPTESGAKERKQMSYTDLDALFTKLKADKAALLAELVEINKPAGELRPKLDTVMKDNLEGLPQSQIEGLIGKMKNFTYEIKQINVGE